MGYRKLQNATALEFFWPKQVSSLGCSVHLLFTLSVREGFLPKVTAQAHNT